MLFAVAAPSLIPSRLDMSKAAVVKSRTRMSVRSPGCVVEALRGELSLWSGPVLVNAVCEEDIAVKGWVAWGRKRVGSRLSGTAWRARFDELLACPTGSVGNGRLTGCASHRVRHLHRRRLMGEEAPVHRDHLTCDKRAGVARQETNELGDLLGASCLRPTSASYR